MPLEPYRFQPITPPRADISRFAPGSAHSRTTSDCSVWSVDSSPASVGTNITVPSPRNDNFVASDCAPTRSPIRQYGPTLLPKIRTQDQPVLKESFNTGNTHRRAISNASNQSNPTIRAAPVAVRCRTTTPECISLISPTSTTSSTFDAGISSGTASPITLIPSARRPSHFRSCSTSSIPDSILRKYSYPYQRAPSYISGFHYTPSVVPYSSEFIPPPTQVVHTPIYEDLPSELLFRTANDPTTSLKTYLTSPNPAVNLVLKVNTVLGRGEHLHFWWDVRNLRTWDDFNLATIKSVPQLPQLLNTAMAATALPQPSIAPYRLHPDSEASLRDLCRDFYAAKLNSAMRVTLGHSRYISMRTPDRAARGTHEGPHFISNYANDATETLAGNGRGRIVGIVRSFDRWNTGMRHEAANRKVVYLEGLAQLQKHMRDHGCRYGFILTEIELVCVRAGTAERPFFGELELAAPVRLASSSRAENVAPDGTDGEDEPLTALMALWYLHMLARDAPLHGQTCGWKLDVGPPCAMTRMNVLEGGKDAWIPEPGLGEMREARRLRGWVWPADPWNRKKEGGGVGRAGRR